MSVTFSHIMSLTQSQALTWLQHNDPEGEWTDKPGADFVSAVDDNLHDFGNIEQGGPVIVSNMEYGELLEQFFEARDTLRGAGFTQLSPHNNWKPPLGPSASPLLKRIDELTAQLAEAQKQAAYWKVMHDNQVSRNKILRQRPDLPVDRIPAYELVEWAQNLKLLHQTHYTVLYVHDDNLQICAEHIQASDGMKAMAKIAKQQLELGADPMLIAAVPGLHIETTSSSGNITFAGESAVTCSPFIDNHGICNE
jgi:hypothetical protein